MGSDGSGVGAGGGEGAGQVVNDEVEMANEAGRDTADARTGDSPSEREDARYSPRFRGHAPSLAAWEDFEFGGHGGRIGRIGRMGRVSDSAYQEIWAGFEVHGVDALARDTSGARSGDVAPRGRQHRLFACLALE